MNITTLILSVLMGMLSAFPVSASDSAKRMKEPLLADIPPDHISRQQSPAPPDLQPIPLQRDAPRFFCKVIASDFYPFSLVYESGETFSFTFNWGNVSSVVADEVEVIIRFWRWNPGLQSWGLYPESPVRSYDYTDVGTNPGYLGRSLSRKISLEKELSANNGGCDLLKGEPHWARCKYRVTQEVRYMMVSETQPTLVPHGGTGTSTNDWITSAECEKVIEWDFTDREVENEWGSFQLFSNYPGNDYRDFVLSTADPQICRSACVSDSRCEYWTYVRPNHGQGPKAHCWLKDDHTLTPVQDSCCISGNPYEDRH